MIFFKNDLSEKENRLSYIPRYISADEKGVYFQIPSNNVDYFLKYIREDCFESKIENIKSLNNINTEDANPILLYYEFN